jgi:tetratricopeptide (TPR) repeat protein
MMAPTAEQPLAAAARLAQAGRLREAEEVIGYVLRRDPGDAGAICGLASLTLMRGEAQKAFDLLSRARAAHPTHSGILAALANTHHALGRPKDAMVCIETAIRLAPDTSSHRLARIQLLMGQGRQTEAITEAEAALALDGGQADALNAKGAALLALSRIPESADSFAKAHAAEPDRADAAHNLALALALLGRPEEAVIYAERAYINEPADPAYRVHLARLLLAVGRGDEARDMAQSAVAIAPLDIAAHEILAECRVLIGDEEQGLAQFASAVRQLKSSPEACLALARVLRRAGRLEEAFAAVSHARSAAQGNVAAIAFERELNLALGRFSPESGNATDETAEPGEFSTRSVSFADAVFCARWLPTGARLHCRPDEAPLFAGLDRVTLMVASPAATPSVTVLASEIDRGPPASADWKPYLNVSEARRAPWRRAVASLPRPWIGAMWGRAPHDMSLPVLHAALAGLGTSVSLATGAQREPLPEYPDILDGGAHIGTVFDLAAAISEMDAVVANDGLAAHLAGALGKPGVIVVSAGKPWPWRAKEGRSLWYPTLEVVTQTRAADWLSAMTELRRRLEEFAAARSITGSEMQI